MKKYCLVLFYLLWISLSVHSRVSKSAQRPVEVTQMKCEYMISPIGVDHPNPRLTWNYTGNTPFCQEAYQLEIASSKEGLSEGRAVLWNSGRVRSTRSYAQVEQLCLTSQTTYYWRVKSWSAKTGMPIVSPIDSFEMAIMSPSEWKAQWITDQNDDLYRPAPLLRKEFEILKPIQKARLYISGVAYYEAYMNGARIGDQYLDPGYTHYDRRVLYTTHDVTSLVRSGKNAISTVLGNGFYNCQSLAVWNFDQALWRNRPRMIAELVVWHTDGTQTHLSTDPTWKTSVGEYRFNNLYSGDWVDGRCEQAGWKEAGFNDQSWKPAIEVESPAPILESQSMPLIRVGEELKPRSIRPLSDRLYLVDFGANSTGFCKVKLKGAAGSKISLRYGEQLTSEGRLTQEKINKYFQKVGPNSKRRADRLPPENDPQEFFQTDTYILKGDSEGETFQPSFSYKGFQYVEIESDQPFQLVEDDIKALFIHTDVPSVGGFVCSDERLNRLWSATRRSYLGNLHSIPTDCPQREKNGWTADAWIAIDLALLNYDGIKVYEKWMRDFVDNLSEEGRVSGIVPSSGWGYQDWIGPTWDAAMFVIPDALYSYYGDTRSIEQIYPTLQRYLDYLKSREVNGLVQYGIGDWVPIQTVTSTHFTTACSYHLDYLLMAKFAALLGKDPSPYEQKAQKIAELINERFYNPQQQCYDKGSQTSYAYALYTGVVPMERRSLMAKQLNQKVVSNGYKIDFGLLGSKFVPRMLSQYGYSETAFRLLMEDSDPSWLAWIKKGMTTLPEWFQEKEYQKASLNHVFLGDISAWMVNHLAGIDQQQGSVGFEKILIQPTFVHQLDSVDAFYESIQGRIRSRWIRQKDGIRLTVTIPQNTKAKVVVDRVYEVGPGEHTFRVKERK